MKIVTVTFTLLSSWSDRSSAIESVPGWYAADHSMPDITATLYFFDAAKADAAAALLAESPVITSAVASELPARPRRGRRSTGGKA